MRSDDAVLCRDYLPPTLEPILKRNHVEKTVLVQASNSVAESRWLLNLADAYPFIAGVVGWVDLAGPGVAEELNELTAHAKFKGVRHLVESEPADDWLVQPAVLEGLQQKPAVQIGCAIARTLTDAAWHLPWTNAVVAAT